MGKKKNAEIAALRDEIALLRGQVAQLLARPVVVPAPIHEPWNPYWPPRVWSGTTTIAPGRVTSGDVPGTVSTGRFQKAVDAVLAWN